MPIYKYNGLTYDIPDNVVSDFEKKRPDATIAYQVDGNIYDIPLAKREGFLSKYPSASLYQEKVEQAKEIDPFQPESVAKPLYTDFSYQESVANQESGQYYPSPLNEEGRAETEPMSYEDRSRQEYEMLMRQLEEFDAVNGNMMDTYEAYEKAARHQINEGGFALDTMEREYLDANSGEYRARKQERDALNERIKNNSYFNQMRMLEADTANEAVDAISDLMAQNEAENTELHKKMKAMNALAMNPRGSFSGFSKTKEMQEYVDERNDLLTAKRLYENTAQVYAAPINDGEDVLKKFGQGFVQRGDDLDFWTMGIVGIADDMNARAAFQKIQDKFGSVKELANLTDAEIDALLTPSEQLLISAVMDNNAALYARKDNTAGAYEAGAGAADSLMFMAQFLLTGGVGDAATVGTAAHRRLVNWLGRKVGSMSNGLMKDVARGAVKLGVGTAESIGKALVMTPLMPHTYANIADKIMSFDDKGELMDVTDAILTGAADALIETWSESTGDFVNKVLGVPGDITKGIAKKALKNVDFSDWGRMANAPIMKILRKGGFNGFLGEMGEEFIGNAVRSISGLEPDAFKEFTKLENLLVTAGSFAPMTIFGLGVSGAQYGWQKRKLDNAQKAFEAMLREASYTEDQARFVIDELLGSTDAHLTPEKLVANFSPLLRELAFNDKFANNRTQALNSAIDLMWQIARYRTFDGVYHKQEEQQRNDMLAEIQEGTGREFWTTRLSNKAGLDGTAYETDEVRAVEFNDGRVAYVLGGDGVNNTVVYNDGQTGFLSEEQLNEGKANGSIVSDATMGLNDYLTQQVARVRMTDEEQRMFAERNTNIGQVRAQFPIDATVELGTTEAPIQGIVRQQTPNGVIVESPVGVSQLSWEELGHTIGIEVNPQTDAQMEEEAINNLEIADLQRRRAREQRRAQRNAAAEAVLTEEQMVDEAENEGLEKPIPMKADGTVDQTAFWNESPARWAQWKTEQRQDGGAYASTYIQNAIGILEGQIAESEAAFLAESDFDAKDALEQTINQQRARLVELQDLAMQYMPAVIPAETSSEATAEQTQPSAETSQPAAVMADRQKFELDAEYQRRLSLARALAEKEMILKEYFEAISAGSMEAVVMNKQNYKQIMKDMGCDESAIEEVTNAIKEAEEEHTAVNALHVNDKIFVIAEYNYTVEQGRVSYVHERQHNITKRNPELIQRVLSLGLSRETLQKIVKTLSGTDFYDNKSDEVLADEILSSTMEIAYTFDDFSVTLSKLGIPIELINLINEINDEQRNDYSLANARRNTIQRNDRQGSSRQDVGDQGEVSGGILGEEGNGSQETGLRGAESGEGAATGGAEASEEGLQVPVAEVDEESEEDTETILNEDGFEVDEQNEDVRFSVRYLPTPEQREGIIDSIIQITGRTREEAERWLESELSLVPIVLNDKEYLDYAPDSKYKAIKDNSDYPQGTVDFNNICRKRKDFTRMYTRLQRAYPNRIFTAEDLADIRTIMSEDGLVVACGLCYVEDRRQKLGEVADEFIKDLQDGFKSYGKKNATKRANAEKFRSFVGNDTYIPSIYDLITLEGSDKLHDEHKGIWDAFGAYNRARGQQTQNTFQGYAEYKREILTWSDAKVKKVNSLGGLRIFSYSDFEAHHLLDIIQIIIDCAARGVMIQGYTKVPEFARVVEKTGIKLNRSLIPLGDTGIVDGKLAYDPVEGIDINDPNFLESNDNVGNILIGINDEQIRMAMADPFIHYIIPYHARQAGNIRAKLNVGAWTNYIDTQNERKKSDRKRVEKNINIYTDVLNESITNDREFVEKYLEVCREKGYIPKFDQFLDRDAEGNYVYTPGYYKFLVDFKLFDEAGNILPQKPVVAQFDDAFNAQVLLDYAREERETAGEAMNSTYDKIVETLDLGEPTVGEDVRVSESEGPIDLVEEAKKAQANDLMFRFIGEKAAQRLDAMVNATAMMDNLQIARDMEAQLNPDWSARRNPAAMKIKMATGWERGVDGMWRKEMEDFEYKNMPKRAKKTYKLSALIKDSSLFVEYPELKDIEVKFKKLPRNTNGQLIPVGNSFRIELNEDLYQEMNPDYIAAVDNFTNEAPDRMSRILNHTASPEEISDFLNAVGSIPPRLNKFGGKDTLAHEIQHAIQHIEGFAIGGNANMVDARDSQVAPFFTRLGQEMEEAQKLLDEYNDLQGQLVAARIVRDNVQIRYLTSSLTMVATQYKVHYQNIQTIQKLLRNFAPLGESGYHRLSGEVEARNVAERLDMSPEERRESLIADTQDVAHEDQIILRNYLMTDYAADTLVPGHVKGQPMLSDVEMLSDVSFRISKNTRRTIEEWCDKAGLAEDIKEGFVDHLEYTFDDTTEQLCAAKWYLNGSINLPNEDEYKVVGAVKVAKQNKVDPLLYYSPMDIFERFGAPKEKLKPINPDKVSTLKNKTEVPGTDITIYDVEESEESRKNMREIINTHYGKNASPWCLLQGDAYGNLSEKSAEYWEMYSAYPKQVAFKNGRLLAFSANSSRVRTWWDRMDKSYGGVPVAEKLNDAKNRRCSVEIDPKTGKEIKRSNIYSLVEKDGYTIKRNWNEVDGPMVSAQKLKDDQVVAQFNRFTRDDFANDVLYFFLGRPKGIDMVFTLEKSMMFYENGELESYSVEGFRASYARNSRKAWTITTRESTIREFSFNRQGRLIEYFDGQRLIKDRKTLAQVEVPSEYMDIVRRDPKSFMAEAEQLLVETGLAEAYEESQEDIRFRVRTEEEREKLFEDAKEQYGVTDNFNIAGYMLPDGSLLNFADKEGEPNIRGIDHRNIGSIINDREYESRWDYITDFLNEGAIRLMPESDAINLSVKPSEQQREKLLDYFYKKNGYIILELADQNGNSVSYMEYDRGTSPYRIMRDIDGYFNDGIVPQQDIRFRMSNNNQAIFVSNAARAVEGIKQEKATPEQWLKMIEKAGGLKAGEDKWMGLSDWLKASKARTLTKAEVLDYINENMIIIEEQHYSNQLAYDNNSRLMDERYPGWQDAFSFEWDDYRDAPNADILDEEKAATLYNKYNEDKVEVDEDGEIVGEEDRNKVVLWGEDIAKIFFGQEEGAVRPIHETREVYTTKGLVNNHEIALTVPTIESWGKSDMIHFGNAGDGRAVAWIRFGETALTEVVKKDYQPKNEIEQQIKDYIEWCMKDGESLDDCIGYAYNQMDADPEGTVGWTDEAVAAVAKGMRGENTTRVLVIDEIQSNRHQEGREKGYFDIRDRKAVNATRDAVGQAAKARDDYMQMLDEKYGVPTTLKSKMASKEEIAELKRLRAEVEKARAAMFEAQEKANMGGIPDAPFDKNWHELAMKRMLRYAAENGYDVIAWTKGDQQNQRYDLGGKVETIARNRVGENQIMVHIFLQSGRKIIIIVDNEGKNAQGNEDFVGKDLAEILGKEWANKVLSAEDGTEFSGDGLSVGGEGMRGFYDKMLPAFMNKYGKRWGVKVEDIDLPNLGRYGYTMHSIPVTEEMKASVMEGQVMFRMRGENESIQEFFESAVSDYKAKYTELGTLMALPVDDITAMRFGFTLEQLQKINGLYEPGTDIIAIFAHKRIEDTILIENTIFHEDIHYIASFYPHMDKLGKWLMENADMVEAFAEIRDEVETYYEESKRPQEMLCRIVSLAMTTGTTSELDMVVPYELQNIVRQIENEIGYDRGTEESSRKAQWLAQHTGSEEGSEPSAREHPDGRRSDEETRLTAEERRVINEYFPGAFPEEENDTQPDNTGEFSEGEGDIRFSIRTKPAPKKTGKGYKVFYLKDGKLYPPMVANLGGVDTPVGVWLDAEEGTRAGVSKTGRPQVKQGGKGTQGGSGTLAYRPGWHLGEIPYAIQFNRNDENGNRTLFPADFVWAEVEYANDVDYQEEAMSYGMNANGKFQHSLAGLPKLPTDGSYRYRTNPNPETDPWIITGAMKVNRLLTPSEVDQMVIDAGREPQKRQEGAVTDAQIEALNKDLGLVEEEEEVSFRTTGTPTEDVVAEGVSLSPAQLASLAGDIFAALPEDGRKKITDGLNGNVLGLQDAILQIPTSLATKEEWNDEDRQMAEVVAEQMTKAVGIEMTRPFSASEALWTLYNAVNKSTDLVSEASRALVRRNLGFDSQTLEMEKDARDGVRFRTVGNASANAQASMYNRGAANVSTRLKESFVDMHASVEELVKAIEKSSGKVAQGFENILMALNQQSSKGLAAMEEYEQKFLNKMFDAIRKIMDKTDFKYEDIVRYVILKHGLERNEKMAQRDAMAHYQEIYDDIIAKIKGMNPAQKRTYLTNAQLRDADAKAELAVLQGVNTSALTPDQLRDHKKALAKAKKEATEAAEHLVRAQKIATMTEQDAQDELDKIFKKIEKGTDSVYKEMRKNDYSGISSMFYDTLGVDRKNYATEEEYQAALMQAKADKYDTLGDIEGAAQMEVTLFENAVNTDKLWKSINKATKETLRQQYEANMISKDQYENLRNMFEFYVPLRGFADNTAEDMYTYYRRPNSTGYTKPILGAEGRKTEAESPFGWIAAMAGSAIASNVKNEAKLALYYFVANRPDNGIATLSRTWFVHTPGDVDANGKKIFRPAYPPFNQDLSTDAAKQAYEDWQEQMRDLQKQGLAYEAGQRLNLGNSVVNISDTNKPEHIVNVKVGGKDYTIVINGNPRAAQAINGDLNIETNETYNNVLFGPWLRWLSSVNTSYNPEFWATNMMRDMAFTLMAVNIKGDPAYRRKFFKNYAKAFKVISMVIKNEKGTLGNSYIERMYKDFVKYGGVTGFTQIKDSETWEKEIEKYLKNQDPDTTKAIKAVKDGLHAFHRFGESLEQVSRFAAFLTSVETGKSINEAINDAKEITVNFNRKGSGKRITLKEAKTLTKNNGQPLNDIEAAIVSGISYLAPVARSTIMFFNASVQALNAWFKLWKANKLRSLSWVAGYAALGVMNALIHALLDDDDDYLDMPQYERRSSLMLGGNGVYFKWALPQEMSAFYALGELSVETIFGRNPHQSAAAEAAKVMGDMLPVNIAKIIIEKDGWVEAIPSQVKPFLELVRNEDYKGDVIFNEQKWLSEGERERTANWESAYKGTGRPYIEISKLLNNLTDNKDLDEAGWINIHPESLEHVVESMTGGVGRSVSKLFNFIMAAFDPEEDVTVRQFPFLNRILTINDERYKNVHVNDVYDYYAAEAEHALTLKKKYEKDKDKDSYNKLLKSDEYKWATIYSRYKKTIKQYQEKIKAAEGTKERMELMKQQDELKRKMIKEISDL